MVKNKNTEIQFTDEYFLNLTMDYDKRDDSIYPKWAVWCYNSDDKYYIDGKDGHFYTHVRTDEEIVIEKKRHQLNEILFTQNHENISDEDWQKYEEWFRDQEREYFDHILDFNPPTYEEWKNNQEN